MKVEVRQIRFFEGVPDEVMKSTIVDPKGVQALRANRDSMRATIEQRTAKLRRAQEVITHLSKENL